MIHPNDPSASASIKVDPSKTPVAKLAVIRFIRPAGQRQVEMFPVSLDTFMQWRALQRVNDQKLRLTVEDLNNGTESLCIEHADKGDIDIAVINPKKVNMAQHFTVMIDRLSKKQ